MTEEAQPESLQLESQVFSLAFHPSQDIVATGLITGDVHCYRYGLEKNEHIYSGKYHKKSCRTIEFSHDGKMLYSGSRDKSIQGLDIETQQVTFIKAKAHEEPINTMLTLNERYLATGDDAGVVKLWDMRKQGEAMMWHENSDFISKITYVPEKKTMVVAGGDGCLSIFDIRKTEAVAVSENQDDELLSVQVIKNGRKAVVGTQDGILGIFSWNDWGDVTDRFLGHPKSIDTMVKINEDIICTGSSDGLIRVVQIHPNKLLGVVGEHDDFPVEQIRLSHDNQYMGSCAHDQTVKFWNIGYLFDEDDDDEEEIEAEEAEQQIELDQAPLDTESVEQMKEPKDSDNSDIEPEENNKRKKKQREKKEKKLPANFDIETSAAVDFFSDL